MGFANICKRHCFCTDEEARTKFEEAISAPGAGVGDPGLGMSGFVTALRSMGRLEMPSGTVGQNVSAPERPGSSDQLFRAQPYLDIPGLSRLSRSASTTMASANVSSEIFHTSEGSP